MSFAKGNYEIYNKKLLVIIQIFEKYCLKPARTFIENLIYIIRNHKNLKYFMNIKDLNRKQT